MREVLLRFLRKYVIISVVLKLEDRERVTRKSC